MDYDHGKERRDQQEVPRRNIALVLAYEGTDYRGWQFQPGELTIQGVVQEKISLMTGEPVNLMGSGRTDSGVHALAQVANFRTLSRIPVEGFLRGLNSLLPEDIVIRSAWEAPDEFHARYAAQSKVYLYVVLNDDRPDPFWRRFAWRMKGTLDVDAMNEAASCLLGQQDFSAFRAVGSSVSHPVRIVTKARWRRFGGNRLVFEIEANGFLRHMVRNIVGTLVEVGHRKADTGFVERVLKGRNRQEAGMTAPAWGLFLKKVRYAT